MFAGKTVLIVGAGNRDGIGFATARMLAEQGASLALADLGTSEIRSLAKELPSPERHAAYAIDVTDEASVRGVVDGLSARGRIDGAVIAAGIYSGTPFLDLTRAEWDRVFAINATGAFLVAQAVARSMLGHGGGRIVAIASIAARVPQMTATAYGASKAAVIQLVRGMALQLARHGITVNALCPGSTATSMMGTDQARLDAAVHGSLAQWRLGIPLGKLADPGDQAAAIAFLLSDGARHITGQILSVDGGQTAL